MTAAVFGRNLTATGASPGAVPANNGFQEMARESPAQALVCELGEVMTIHFSLVRYKLMQRHSTLSNEKGALLSESDPGGNRTAVPCPGHLARVRTRRFKAAISE